MRVRTGIQNIRFIDPSGLLQSLTGEYNSIINALESIGYTQNKNLVAAPVRIENDHLKISLPIQLCNSW